MLGLADRSNNARWWTEASFHHEVLWALAEVLKSKTLGDWSPRVCAVARNLAEKWRSPASQWDPQKGKKDPDEGATVALADRFLAKAEGKVWEEI